MREHLTSAKLDNGDLPARMALTKPGQVTWVDLCSNEKCVACAHYQDGGVTKGKSKGFGRCALVKAHTKKNGTLFYGPSALACTQFREKD